MLFFSGKFNIGINDSPNYFENLLYLKDNRIFKVSKKRFDEVYLDSSELWETILDYIHRNPLQNHWNLAANPEEYWYSSAFFL